MSKKNGGKMSRERFIMEMTEERKELLSELQEKLGLDEKSQTITEAMYMANHFIDIQSKKEEEIKEMKDRWMVEEV